MIDTEKVKQALKFCFDEQLGIVSCDGCAYKDKMVRVDGYRHCQLADDALALLKEQEDETRQLRLALNIMKGNGIKVYDDGSTEP